MTDEISNLILEHLRAIRGDIAQIGERIDRVEVLLSTIEHHMSGFLASSARQQEGIDSLRRRTERIERRLELVEEGP